MQRASNIRGYSLEILSIILGHRSVCNPHVHGAWGHGTNHLVWAVKEPGLFLQNQIGGAERALAQLE